MAAAAMMWTNVETLRKGRCEEGPRLVRGTEGLAVGAQRRGGHLHL